MSLFIHSDNIQIIWQTIQSFNLFHELFNDPKSKEVWFDKIITQFNETTKNVVTSKQLIELNRNTIDFMVNDLKNNNLRYRTNQNQNNHNIASMPAREKQTVIGSDLDTLYVQRQKEYENMRKNSIPPEIDFRITEIDEPIQDINLLIEKHKKERQYSFAVKKETSTVNKQIPTPKVIIDSKQELPPPMDVTILECDTPPSMDVTISKNDKKNDKIKNNYVEFFIDEPPNSIKHVKWNNTQDDIENRFNLLEKKIESLKEEINLLKKVTN